MTGGDISLNELLIDVLRRVERDIAERERDAARATLDERDSYLVTCPYCGERREGEHAGSTISHVIGCADKRISRERTAIRRIAAAAAPLRHFIDQFDRKPLSGLDDAFYCIHRGTEWEAELKLSDLRNLRDVLCDAVRGEMNE